MYAASAGTPTTTRQVRHLKTCRKEWACPICSAAKSRFVQTAPKKNPGYTGTSITEPMETLMTVPAFAEILLLGGQLARPPLDDGAPVSVKTIIGKQVKHSP